MPTFTPDGAPEGVEVKFVPFTSQRPIIHPRSLFVHTNAASGEGSIEASWNWALAKPNSNTLPHYQVDRSGRARKMLPSNRKGIGNGTVDAYQGTHGDLSTFSLVVETADLGYGTGKPGDLNEFTPAQGETVARIIAYESIVWRFPIQYPTEWFGAGVAAHTEPFTYPYTTLYKGKTCPGSVKKRQLREWLMPRARAVVAEWALPSAPSQQSVKVPAMFVSFWEPDGSWWLIYDGLNRRDKLTAGEAWDLVASGIPRIDLPVDLLPQTGDGWSASRPV